MFEEALNLPGDITQFTEKLIDHMNINNYIIKKNAL